MILPNTSPGGEPAESTTNVWTLTAQTPPALVTIVANSERAPHAIATPAHIWSDVLPGRVLRCNNMTRQIHGNNEPVSTGSQAQYPPQSRIR